MLKLFPGQYKVNCGADFQEPHYSRFGSPLNDSQGADASI